MSQSLSSFLGAFAGGLRPNKFEVTIAPPQTGGLSIPTTTFHIRAASIPASTITTINVPYRGRIFKMPGVRTYQTWQITVLDDIKTDLHKVFHQWSNALKDHVANTTAAGLGNFTDLMGTFSVKQLNYNGTPPHRTFTLQGCWPNTVGPVALDMENNDTILTFTVDLEYQYFNIDDSSAGG